MPGPLQSTSVFFANLFTRPTIQFDVVNPNWMSLREWADAFVYVMAFQVALPLLTDESSFERWATEIAEEPTLAPYNLPYPQGFSWNQWATAVNNALSTAASG